MVDLNDGSYSTTRIYPVNGTPGNGNPNKPVGDFYVQFNGDLCAYHIPGGSFSMRFTGSNTHFVDDGQGGRFLEGTFELPILEGTGIYKPFVGDNHMVDKLLAFGDGSGNVDSTMLHRPMNNTTGGLPAGLSRPTAGLDRRGDDSLGRA
jgi:hypothetical protein